VAIGCKKFLQRSHIDFAGDRLEFVDEMTDKTKKLRHLLLSLIKGC